MRRAWRSRVKEPNNSIFCRVTGFTSDFLSFIDVELIRFFRGALHLFCVVPCSVLYTVGCGIRGLTSPLGASKSFQSGQRRQWKTPRGPSGSAVLLCVCSSSSLLGDLLGVSRSVECDFLSILYYATFFFSFFTISSFIRDILLCCISEFSACSLHRFSYQYL